MGLYKYHELLSRVLRRLDCCFVSRSSVQIAILATAFIIDGNEPAVSPFSIYQMLPAFVMSMISYETFTSVTLARRMGCIRPHALPADRLCARAAAFEIRRRAPA